MTEQELNSVRELKKRIRDLESHLQSLRTAAENLTPILDGLPHSTERKSRVEKIALMIVEEERELEDLREAAADAAVTLARRIKHADLTFQEREVAMLRYVACMNFRDIEAKLHMSDARIFFLHRQAEKKIKVVVQ